MTFQEIEYWFNANRKPNSLFWEQVGKIINSDSINSDKRRALKKFATDFFVDTYGHDTASRAESLPVNLYAMCADAEISTDFAYHILKSKVPEA